MKGLSFLLVLLSLVAGLVAHPLAAEAAWVPVGPPGGPASLLVVHPRNPRILWAGAPAAGLFRSVDGGVSWRAIHQRLLFPSVRTLAVAPSDPDVLYAFATGPTGFGIFRSSDGGETWALALDCRPQPSPGCPSIRFVVRLAVHPDNPRIVFAATRRGLLKSVNGGARWRRTGRSLQTHTVVFDPEDPDVLLAGGPDGVSRSRDGGASWVPWSNGMSGFSLYVTEIVIDPESSRRLWAGGPHGLYRSTDGGAHWRLSVQGLQSPEVQDLALAPGAGRSRPTVWAATSTGVFRSRDGGLTWAAAGPDLQGRSIGALEAHPSRPDILWAAVAWVGSDAGGIYKTVDGGAHWRFSSRGYSAVPVTALALDPVTPGVLWAGTPGLGVYRGTGGGSTWERRNGVPPAAVPREVSDLAVDPEDPDTVWAAGFEGIHVTEDGGATWERRSTGLLDDFGQVPVTSVRLAPSAPSTAYAGTARGLFKTVDAGAHWTRLETLPFPLIVDIRVDLRDPDVVFVAAGELWISRDGGDTWERADVWNAPSVIQTLATDPRNPDVLYASGEDGIFRSTDNGRTWRQVIGFPLIWTTDLAIEPTGAVWTISPIGIYRSTDGDRPWTPVPGIDAFVPREIEADPRAGGTVFVGTSGGVYRWREGD